MRAVQFDKWGPPSVMHLRTDYPKPICKVGEVLIRIYAASINPADVAIRSGSFFPLLAKKPKVCIPAPHGSHCQAQPPASNVPTQSGLVNAMQRYCRCWVVILLVWLRMPNALQR